MWGEGEPGGEDRGGLLSVQKSGQPSWCPAPWAVGNPSRHHLVCLLSQVCAPVGGRQTLQDWQWLQGPTTVESGGHLSHMSAPLRLQKTAGSPHHWVSGPGCCAQGVMSLVLAIAGLTLEAVAVAGSLPVAPASMVAVCHQRCAARMLWPNPSAVPQSCPLAQSQPMASALVHPIR